MKILLNMLGVAFAGIMLINIPFVLEAFNSPIKQAAASALGFVLGTLCLLIAVCNIVDFKTLTILKLQNFLLITPESKPSVRLIIGAYIFLLISALILGRFTMTHFSEVLGIITITVHVLIMSWFGARKLYWDMKYGPKE